MQVVPCKYKGITANRSHSKNTAAVPGAYSESANTRNAMKWRNKLRKQIQHRWLRQRLYFLAKPILAFHITDELIGLTPMK